MGSRRPGAPRRHSRAQAPHRPDGAERDITHMECLANLEAVVGRGRFRFIGLPLKIRGGTASPIRAVALFE
jgi:hypothetical protein